VLTQAVQNHRLITTQGRNEGGKGGQFPGRWFTMGAPNHCGGRRITAKSAEKSPKCYKYFLQYSKFASERAQVWTWGRQTCFLPRAPSNLVTPLSPPPGLQLTSGKAEGARPYARGWG